MATVLIADDDEGMRILMSASLARVGHQALVAQSGAEGIAMMHQYEPDLLVIDANMPPLNGDKAIAQLRAEGNTCPAILISAAQEVPAESQLDSYTRFLAKPFSPPQFISYISEVLSQ